MNNAEIKISTNDALLLSGNLCFDTVTKLCEQGKQLLQGRSKVTFDLSEVRYCDSAGLVFLIELLRQAQKQQLPVRYTNLPSQLMAIARISGVDKMLPL